MVPGIELSCLWRKHTIHIVGLDMDPADSGFRQALAMQNANRWERAEEIGRRMAKLGFTGVLESAIAETGGTVPGRPHFANALVAMGYVANHRLAFKHYLGAGKPGDVQTSWPDLATVVTWIRQAGGVAVLAHPRKYRLTATRLRAVLDDLLAVGGRGWKC